MTFWTPEEGSTTHNRRARMAEEYYAGEPLVDIARRYNLTINSLRVIISRDKHNRKDRIRTSFSLPRAFSEEINLEAKERGLRTGEFLHKLLHAVIRDQLVDAIIDDK